jgi:hypothetical protein
MAATPLITINDDVVTVEHERDFRWSVDGLLSEVRGPINDNVLYDPGLILNDAPFEAIRARYAVTAAIQANVDQPDFSQLVDAIARKPDRHTRCDVCSHGPQFTLEKKGHALHRRGRPTLTGRSKPSSSNRR